MIRHNRLTELDLIRTHGSTFVQRARSPAASVQQEMRHYQELLSRDRYAGAQPAGHSKSSVAHLKNRVIPGHEESVTGKTMRVFPTEAAIREPGAIHTRVLAKELSHNLGLISQTVSQRE